MTPRSVTVLGSTGSVGRSTLDLLEREPDRWTVNALTANSDVAGLAEQARRIRPQVTRTFPLDEAAAAHALMEAGGHLGKIVLEVR